MPGLVGIISENALDEQFLDRMVCSIKHDENYRVNKYSNSFFGIARIHLGIFNPEPQPIFNEDKSLCIFMDGKVYGYGEEILKLKRKGHIFNIENDPEFCLHLYEEYGKDFVKKINGDFVIVICNLKENELHIVNDRYGLRPHYYILNNDKLLFSPEVKAFLEYKKFKKDLNEEAIVDFFAFGKILENKTFFKNVELLRPSSILTFRDGEISIKQYWDFNYEPDYSKSEDDFVNELVKTFKNAVRIRMKENHRYGVSLSGGLDSRSIVAAMDEKVRQDVLSSPFGPLDCDEVKIAKKVSKKAGTKFKAVEIIPEMIIDGAEKLVYLTDGMVSIGYGYTPFMFRVLMKDVDVVFDGFEFDVTLGGSYLNKDILNAKEDKALFNILYKSRIFSDDELDKLFVKTYNSEISQSSFKKALDKINEKHPGNKNDHFLLRNHALRYILMGHPVVMRNMVECTLPTMDNELIDVIQKIPPELRLNHHIYRKFLKKLSPELAKFPYNQTGISAVAPLILLRAVNILRFGKEIANTLLLKLSNGKIFLADKRYGVYYNEWLRTNEKYRRVLEELLLDEKTELKRYFNQRYIKDLIHEHIKGESNNYLKIFHLAAFELFLRLFVK
jgi:asparagine synthase (glutamine-hydrolysing)